MTKGELTRQRIVEEAAPVFNQLGYAGASMQDIMRVTGLEKGGIYRHFPSKEDLAVEAFRYSLAKLIHLRTQDIDHVEGALPQLRYAIQRFISTPSAIPGGCPLMNTAIDADDGNPVLRRLALKGFTDWRARLVSLVQGGKASGEIKASTDARSIANTIIATLEGALMLSRLEGNKHALHDAALSLDVVLDNIAAERS